MVRGEARACALADGGSATSPSQIVVSQGGGCRGALGSLTARRGAQPHHRLKLR